MSAWIVDKAHIDALISAGVENDILEPEDAGVIGQMLWKECHRSVSYRYDERNRTPAYTPTLVTGLDPITVLKLAHCYSYQSCEHPDWPVSHAATWIALLRATLEAREDVDTTPVPARYSIDANGYRTLEPAYLRSGVYDQAPWGISHLTELDPTAIRR